MRPVEDCMPFGLYSARTYWMDGSPLAGEDAAEAPLEYVMGLTPDDGQYIIARCVSQSAPILRIDRAMDGSPQLLRGAESAASASQLLSRPTTKEEA